MMALAALMLAGTSCQKEGMEEPSNGEYANVTFTAQLPSGITQRAKANGPRKAYSDGKTATELYYAVYEDGVTDPKPLALFDGGGTSGKATFPSGSLSTTVTLKLATDKKYDIVFFAKAPSAPYTFSAENHNFTIAYDNVKANDESLDAFYAKYDYDGTSTDNVVKLYRPFAQLNIGTSDLDKYNESTPKLTQTEVEVSANVGDALDLLDGSVKNVAKQTFKMNAIPTEDFVKDGYKYLAMDYLLVGDVKQLVDVTLKSDAKEVGTYTNVPVQRNYRTNIYGPLLTKSKNFQVDIVPGYDGEYESEYVVNDEDLATAAKVENAVIQLKAGTTFNMPTNVAKGVTFVGESNSSAINVTDENGEIRTDFALDNVTFKGLTLKAATTTWHDQSLNQNSGLRKSSGLKFEDCTITGCITLGKDEWEFNNCTFNQTIYEYNVYTYNCPAPVFTNCTFNSAGKALKVFGYASSDVTVENCKFYAVGAEKAAKATGKTFNKTAITIDDQGLDKIDGKYKVIINNCTQEEFTMGEFLKTSYLYDVEGGKHTTVVLDEKTVYPQ